MFCKNCGKEVDDQAVICPYCGVQLGKIENGKSANETCTLAIVGFVLSFFISVAGLICSIIAYRKCRDENLNGKGFAIAGIAISTVSVVVWIIYIIVVVGIIGAAAALI